MEKKWNGFIGKILRIDLNHSKIVEEALSREVARKYLGGVGYAAKILWDELKPGIDPLSPENKLIMATGPLTGTLCPASGSWSACFKSPQTNVWAESRCGADWGPELKFAGFDMVILEGRSEKPVYVWICDGEAEIRSAERLAGSIIPDTEDAIKEEVGDYDASVASIGPAGEKLVRFANIMVGGSAAGRCGGGTVMGSKNVKAVAVRGHGEISVAAPEAFLALVEEVTDLMLKNPVLRRFSPLGEGTMETLRDADLHGDLPTKYGRSNAWGIGPGAFDKFEKNYVVDAKACFGCIIGCKRLSQVKGGRWLTPLYEGPEYETTGTLMHFLYNDDLEAAIHAGYLCNIFGMDTISCGDVIALAMECYDRGWITKADTDDIELTWGNMEATVAMIKKIASREGFGDILAEGTRIAAERIGKGAPDIALHVKGLDIPMHDPRGGKTLALQYGTANRGACHTHPLETHNWEIYKIDFGLKPYGLPPRPGVYDETGKGKGMINKLIQEVGMTPNILGLCLFPTYFHTVTNWTKSYAAITSAAVGWDISDTELLKISERVLNLQRCFNVREGIRRKDDMIPKRLREVPAFGPFNHVKETAIIDYEGMLDEYYEAMGWDKATGIPTPEKLKELGLDEIATQLTTLT